MLRSASSMICGEIIGTTSPITHAARMTPAAPVGEFSPARIALVSRNAFNLLCISLLPYLLSRVTNRAINRLFGICRSWVLRFGERAIRLDFHLLYFPLEGDYLFVYLCVGHTRSIALCSSGINKSLNPAFEHFIHVPLLVIGAMVFNQLIGMQDVGADLASPLDFG